MKNRHFMFVPLLISIFCIIITSLIYMTQKDILTLILLIVNSIATLACVILLLLYAKHNKTKI